MVEKLTPLNPAFFEVITPVAWAYQLRYLARRAISDLDASRVASLSRAWVSQSRLPLIEEPVKSVKTPAIRTPSLSMSNIATPKDSSQPT